MQYFYTVNLEVLEKKEKGRDLTQSYDKNPYTHRKIEVRQRFRIVKESST